jgi:hypothetical protein
MVDDELNRRINIEALTMQHQGRKPDGCYIVNTEADFKLLMELKADFVHVERRGNRAYVWTVTVMNYHIRQFTEDHKRKLRASKAGAHNKRTFENAKADPFYLPYRNFAISRDILSGDTYATQAKRHDLGRERIRQIFNKWMRELQLGWDCYDNGRPEDSGVKLLRTDAWYITNQGYQKLGRKLPRVEK